MGLSSNIVWHQTTKEAFFCILDSKCLKFSYSLEQFNFLKERLAFPMISLCDLPFSEIGSFMNNIGYGGWILGFDKKWSVEKRFNPVLYCEPDSNLSTFLHRQLSQPQFMHSPCVVTYLYLLSYIKPIEGQLNTHGESYENYRFCDEREIRLTLPLSVKEFLFENKYKSYKKENGNSVIRDKQENFDWKDIKYIIVPEDKNIVEVQIKLHELRCNNNNIHIFSHQQVKEDFIGFNHNKIKS